MHNLEQLISEWRKTMMAAPNINEEMLDELENHLRETVDPLVCSGMAIPEAFQRAVAQLGSAPEIASEFRKLDQSSWLPVKVVAGMGVVGALLLASLLGRFDNVGSNVILASHVFLITLGYMTVFFTGALGICFVCQHSFSEFTPSRLHSIRRANLTFGSVALGLTVVGVALGAVWAKAEWGRYWAWDLKETGGLTVIVWLTGFLIAQRFAERNSRSVLAVSVLGNIVVGLAWFGPDLWRSLHASSAQNNSLVLLAAAAVVSNLALFLIGFAPSGWLRPPKA